MLICFFKTKSLWVTEKRVKLWINRPFKNSPPWAMLCHGRTWARVCGIPIPLLEQDLCQHSILTKASTTRENPEVAPPSIHLFLGYHFCVITFVLEKKFNDAEMEALRVPPKFRDYCAHLWVPFADCKNKNWPWSYRCAHESHAIVMCQAREWV